MPTPQGDGNGCYYLLAGLKLPSLDFLSFSTLDYLTCENDMTEEILEPRDESISLASFIKRVSNETPKTAIPLNAARKEVERINNRLVEEYGFMPTKRPTAFGDKVRINHRVLQFNALPVDIQLIPIISTTPTGSSVMGRESVDPALAKADADAVFKSINDLLKRRSALLAGIVQAQATPGTVSISGDTFSIAAALAIREDYETTTVARIKMLVDAISNAERHHSRAVELNERAVADKRKILAAQPKEAKKQALEANHISLGDKEDVDAAYNTLLDRIITDEKTKYSIDTTTLAAMRGRLERLRSERDTFLGNIDTALDVANVSVLVMV